MTPTLDQRRVCFAELRHYADIDAYVSDLSLSSIWGDGEEDGIPPERLDWLRAIYEAYAGTIAVPDLCREFGIGKYQLADAFGIPHRTVEDWCAGKRTPPAYVLAMMQEILQKD